MSFCTLFHGYALSAYFTFLRILINPADKIFRFCAYPSARSITGTICSWRNNKKWFLWCSPLSPDLMVWCNCHRRWGPISNSLIWSDWMDYRSLYRTLDCSNWEKSIHVHSFFHRIKLAMKNIIFQNDGKWNTNKKCALWTRSRFKNAAFTFITWLEINITLRNYCYFWQLPSITVSAACFYFIL